MTNELQECLKALQAQAAAQKECAAAMAKLRKSILKRKGKARTASRTRN